MAFIILIFIIFPVEVYFVKGSFVLYRAEILLLMLSFDPHLEGKLKLSWSGRGGRELNRRTKRPLGMEERQQKENRATLPPTVAISTVNILNHPVCKLLLIKLIECVESNSC